MKDQPKSEAKDSNLDFILFDRERLEQEITRLKAELEKERELRNELVDSLHALLKYSRRWLDEYTNERIQSLIERQKTR